MKKCARCGEIKSISLFTTDKSAIGGVRRLCKACRRAQRTDRAPITLPVDFLDALAAYLLDPYDIVRAPKRARRSWMVAE